MHCVSCAFFRGEVEHPGYRLLTTKIDDPVYVAINTEGVYVIDRDDFVCLSCLVIIHIRTHIFVLDKKLTVATIDKMQ